MTNRAIVVLAMAATACLVLGARLLEAASPGTAVVAVLAIGAGTALAATAVAGAWRPVPQRSQSGSIGVGLDHRLSPSAGHSPRPGSVAGPT